MLLYIIMGNIIKECKIEITIGENDIEVKVKGKDGEEKLLADFMSDGFIPVWAKILEDTGLPDDLTAKLFGRWIRLIGKRLEKLDFNNLEDRENLKNEDNRNGYK